MSVCVQIQSNNSRMLAFEFSNNWQWEEWHDAITKANTLAGKDDLLQSAPMIFRMPDNGTTPGDFMSSAWSIMQRLYHRPGPMVVVTRSRYLRMMFESLKNLNSNRLQELYVATSMDDASMIMQAIDG